MAPLQLESSKREGIYGWGPSSGPAGCKLFIFLRHTSPLAVKLLSIVHGPNTETRFWIDFDGKKVPAVPHKFYFNENEYPSEDVNIKGLGRDREILLALVPPSVRRRVPIWLYVVGDRGVVEHNVQLGYFQYDENSFNMKGIELIVVPLKKYDEVKWKGQALLNFLASERPTLEDARLPKQYLTSEMTRVVNTSGTPMINFMLIVVHLDKSERSIHDYQSSNACLKQQSKTRPKGKKRKNDNSPASQSLSPDDRDGSYSDSAGLVKRQRSSSLSSSPGKASQAGPVRNTRPKAEYNISVKPIGRQQYVTIKFTDPKPSSLGMPALNAWSNIETSRKRRLIAFTCHTDNPKFTAYFTAKPIPHLGLASAAAKVVSCIYVPPEASQMPNTCIITSFDFINLISWMLRKPAWFTVDERNRVRRNLEIFNPQTLHKEGAYDVWDLFKQVTGYQHPKPWNIQKDFKVFDWSLIEAMMKEISKKYTVVVGENEVLSPVEQDDIEDELLQANRDLIEEIARLNGPHNATGATGGIITLNEQQFGTHPQRPVFARKWPRLEIQPGHACQSDQRTSAYETGSLGTRHHVLVPGHTFSAEEIEVIRQYHDGQRTRPVSHNTQSWDNLTQSTPNTDLDGHFTNEYHDWPYHRGTFGENVIAGNYFHHDEFISPGWPFDVSGVGDLQSFDEENHLHRMVGIQDSLGNTEHSAEQNGLEDISGSIIPTEHEMKDVLGYNHFEHEFVGAADASSQGLDSNFGPQVDFNLGDTSSN